MQRFRLGHGCLVLAVPTIPLHDVSHSLLKRKKRQKLTKKIKEFS